MKLRGHRRARSLVSRSSLLTPGVTLAPSLRPHGPAAHAGWDTDHRLAKAGKRLGSLEKVSLTLRLGHPQEDTHHVLRFQGRHAVGGGKHSVCVLPLSRWPGGPFC